MITFNKSLYYYLLQHAYQTSIPCRCPTASWRLQPTLSTWQSVRSSRALTCHTTSSGSLQSLTSLRGCLTWYEASNIGLFCWIVVYNILGVGIISHELLNINATSYNLIPIQHQNLSIFTDKAVNWACVPVTPFVIFSLILQCWKKKHVTVLIKKHNNLIMKSWITTSLSLQHCLLFCVLYLKFKRYVSDIKTLLVLWWSFNKIAKLNRCYLV